MDLKSLSDEQLDAELKKLEADSGGSPPPPPSSSSLSQLSDEQLNAELRKTVQPEPSDSIIEEMHPEFTTADRLVVKNFSNNNEAAVNYLQKRHPNLEVKVRDRDGKILARKRDGSEPEYRALDPDTGFFSNPTEMLRDVGDVGYDIASGIGTSAATAAGGIGGALGGGVGAIPAAIGAGAASSAGFEGLKQSLGKALGVGEFSGTDLAIATGLGAASPALMGTGASVKNMAKAGLTEAQQLAQRGAVGRGWDFSKQNLLPWLSEKASGVSSVKTKLLADNYDKILSMESDPKAVTNLIRENARDVGTKLREEKKTSWKLLQSGLDSVKSPIDISPAQEVFKRHIDNAEQIARETGASDDKELVTALKSRFDDLFGYKEISPGAVIGRKSRSVDYTVDSDGFIRNPSTNNLLRDPITNLPIRHDAAYPVDPKTLGLKEEGAVRVFSAEPGYDLVGAGEVKISYPNSRSALSADMLGRRLGGAAGLNKMKAGDIGGIGNRFGAGDSFNDKAIAQASLEAKQALDATMDSTLPESVKVHRAKYGEAVDLEKRLKPLLGGKPKTAYRTYRNLDTVDNRPLLEALVEADARYGTKSVDTAKLAQTFATYEKPGALPLSAQGASGLARAAPLALAGAGLGHYLGRTQGDGAGYGTGLLGGALGAFMGGPAAMRAYIAMNRAATKGATKAQSLLPKVNDRASKTGQAAFNVWLNTKKEKESN